MTVFGISLKVSSNPPVKLRFRERHELWRKNPTLFSFLPISCFQPKDGEQGIFVDELFDPASSRRTGRRV